MMCRRALACALTVAALVVGASAAAYSAPEDGLFGVRAIPEDANADDRGYIIEKAARGATLTRHIAVSNRTAEPISVRVYAGSAEMAEGEFVFGDREDRNTTTRWTTVTPSTLRVQPGREVRAKVRISVPRGTTPGERYAVIWAELPSADESGVTVVNRVGVRVYLTVSSAVLASSGFPMWILIVVAVLVLGFGVVMATRGRRDFSGRYVLRRNPCPKNPPRGRAWA
jgi:hypothetical protein